MNTIRQWLIHDSWLRGRLQSSNNWGSAIIRTEANTSEISYLYTESLRFVRSLKLVEKFWEARPRFECLICSGIDYDCLRDCD